MKLAVVIPFLNEAAALPKTLAALFDAIGAFEGVDVIAVDGGSSDSSRSVLARYPSIRTLDAPPGRASQMNAGARAANDAEIILFLHADSRLPSDALMTIRDALRHDRRWGRFDATIEGRSKLLPAVSSLMNLRSRVTGIATGDQAMFVSRKAFEIVDGLECLALADVQLAYGHQRDLVAGLVLQNILVFAYGLGDFALVQQLLCGLNVFALVISHARTGTNLPLGVRPDVLLNLRR